MASPMPPRTALANLPTPLQRLDRISAELDADIWVKRDDLTGAALSGNKVRKLEFLLHQAERGGADTLVTCGAVTSTHCRATAVAAAQRGLGCHLLLRGPTPRVPDGNLLLDVLVGAETTFITQAQWAERNVRMGAIATRLRAEGRAPYVIPEGGSNAVGAWGYVLGAHELRRQAQEQGLDLRRVVHATGSGGTTAGLALGFADEESRDVEVIGVAVCDDRAYFDTVIARILDDVAESGSRPAAPPRWSILEGYKGLGYAQASTGELTFYAHVARSEGLILDPVYTGKAFHAMYREIEAGRMSREGATVFLHTGGIFGLFSFGAQLGGVLSLGGPSHA